MTAIILAIHTIIVLGLVAVVLLQRSEGGALGMGGGGGGFMSGRGAANALTRSTTMLAALFFVSSMALALTADRGSAELEVLQDITGADIGEPSDGELDQDDILDILGDGPAATAPPTSTSDPVADDAPAEAGPPTEQSEDALPNDE